MGKDAERIRNEFDTCCDNYISNHPEELQNLKVKNFLYNLQAHIATEMDWAMCDVKSYCKSEMIELDIKIESAKAANNSKPKIKSLSDKDDISKYDLDITDPSTDIMNMLGYEPDERPTDSNIPLPQ